VIDWTMTSPNICMSKYLEPMNFIFYAKKRLWRSD
jgi:hypothetical protein